jgi:predicted alpha/beta hydrolase
MNHTSISTSRPADHRSPAETANSAMYQRVREALATLIAFMGTPDDAVVASVARGEIPRMVAAAPVHRSG